MKRLQLSKRDCQALARTQHLRFSRSDARHFEARLRKAAFECPVVAELFAFLRGEARANQRVARKVLHRRRSVRGGRA